MASVIRELHPKKKKVTDSNGVSSFLFVISKQTAKVTDEKIKHEK